MTTISKDAELVTFINVFTVEPANQKRLVELLMRVTGASVRHATRDPLLNAWLEPASPAVPRWWLATRGRREILRG